MRQPTSISGRRSHSVFRSAVVVGLLGTMLGSASAGTEVRGSPDALYLRADNATVSEVLAAISAKFKLKYPLSSNLDHTITGVYSGSLRHVLMRILDGSSYVLTYAGDGVELKLLGNASSEPAQPNSVVLNQNAIAPSQNQNAIAPSQTAAAPTLLPTEIPRLVPK